MQLGWLQRWPGKVLLTMRVLLREVGTRKYLTRVGDWTDTKEEAHDFTSSVEAIDFWSDRTDRDVEIVLSFEDPYYDVTTCLTASVGTSVTPRRKSNRALEHDREERGKRKSNGAFLPRAGSLTPTAHKKSGK